MAEAASFQVDGMHGGLLIVALILFVVAAIVAWRETPHVWWPSLVALGLGVATLAMLVVG